MLNDFERYRPNIIVVVRDTNAQMSAVKISEFFSTVTICVL